MKREMIWLSHVDTVVTMDPELGILHNVSIGIAGNRIVEIGRRGRLTKRTIDGRGKILFPGLINTHHHLFQAFLRHVPAMQNQRIDRWIDIACELGKQMQPVDHYYAALANLLELVESGCTTTADMLYLFPQQYDHQELFAATVQAAADIGIRFHPFRGSLSLSKKDGALFADDVVETSQDIENNTRRMLEKFHNPADDAMVKVGIAPCTIFTSTAEDYRRAAQLADEYHVNLQTHLSESQFEQQYAQDKLGMTPLQYLEEQGWVGSAVSFVHGIEIRSGDRHRLQRHQQSIVHCPISNARAPVGQTGLAPVAEFLADEINVSLGVDGSAGNDSSNLMEEMRWARTLAGARKESTYLPVMDVWRMGTINGARALQWESTIGSIAVGKCADLCWFDTHDSLAHLGAWDTVGSLLSCQATKADMVMVNGRVLRESGEWVSLHRPAVQKKIQKRWESTFPLEERKKYD